MSDTASTRTLSECPVRVPTHCRVPVSQTRMVASSDPENTRWGEEASDRTEFVCPFSCALHASVCTVRGVTRGPLNEQDHELYFDKLHTIARFEAPLEGAGSVCSGLGARSLSAELKEAGSQPGGNFWGQRPPMQ